MNDVVVDFRPNEGISPEVISDVGTEVSGKMVAALVIGAGSEAAAVIRRIEAQVFAADSSHYIAAKLLAEFTAVDGVEIIKNRPIGSLKKEVGSRFRVNSLMGPPCNLAAETDVVLQDEKAAEAGIEPSAERGKYFAVAVCDTPGALTVPKPNAP